MFMESQKLTIFGIEFRSDSSDRWLGDNGSVLILILLGFTAFNYIYNGLFRPLSTEKVDFVAYYNAALAFKYGLPIYEHMTRFFQEGVLDYKGPLPYVYSPSFVIFLSPLAYLSFKQAALLWNIFSHIFFFLGIITLMKAVKRRYSWLEGIVLLFICMNFTPLFIDYLVGQCNIILFSLITLGLYFYRSNKDIYVGVALALATVIKVIPGLLIGYMLWKRQYKAFFSAISVLCLIFIYSLLFFDVDLYVWYFKSMVSQGIFDAYHDNHSLTGFFSRLFVHSTWTTGIIDSPLFARICILASSALVLLALAYVTRKREDRSSARALRGYALAVMTMLLTSKMTSTPYLVMVLVPFAVLVHELFCCQTRNKWFYLLAAAYGVVAIWYPLPVGRFLDMETYRIYMKGLQVNIFSLQFFALLVIWFYLAFAPLPTVSADSTGMDAAVSFQGHGDDR